jgi:hypothetical protein
MSREGSLEFEEDEDIIIKLTSIDPQVLLYYLNIVRHVTGTGSGLLGGIPRVVVQISALL